MGMTYKKSGVDVAKGEKFVSFIKNITELDTNFGGLFEIPRGYKRPLLVSSADGVGTKLMIAFLTGIHDTVGIDMVAMNVNDVLCRGARPLFFLDYIACGKLSLSVMKQVINGIVEGCRIAGCALIGGETAEMPDFYKPGEYDLSGFCVGVVDKSKLLPKSKKIKKGDIIIGLASSGLHSNGFSLVRKVFSTKEMKRISKELLTPTRIYVKDVLKVIDSVPVKQIAHITGGGFYLKAIKGLPAGLGIKIDSRSWQIPDIFIRIQKKGKISKKEMFSTFNMGIGMTMIVSPKHVDKVMTILSDRVDTYVIGEVKEGKGVSIY